MPNNDFCAVRVQCEDEPISVDQSFLDDLVRLEAAAMFA